MTVLALDPGLDCAGMAVYQLPATPVLRLEACRSLCLWHGSVRTRPADPLTHRLHRIGDELRFRLRAHTCTRLVIERPAIDGTYGRNRHRTRGKDGFIPGTMKYVHQVIGLAAFVGRDLGLDVTLVKAEGRKEIQHQRLAAAWPDLGRTNGDERDAILLGTRVLQHPRFLLTDPVARAG